MRRFPGHLRWARPRSSSPDSDPATAYRLIAAWSRSDRDPSNADGQECHTPFSPPSLVLPTDSGSRPPGPARSSSFPSPDHRRFGAPLVLTLRLGVDRVLRFKSSGLSRRSLPRLTADRRTLSTGPVGFPLRPLERGEKPTPDHLPTAFTRCSNLHYRPAASR